MRLKGVELGDRDEPEVVMKRQATGKNSKIPNIFQFHLPSSFLHSTPLKHGTLYIKTMMQYQKAHTLYMYMNYQSIHFFQLCVCFFVCLYFHPYRRAKNDCGFYFFFNLLSWEMMGCHFNWVWGDADCWGGGVVIIISFFYLFHNSCLGFPSQ